ncbi:MAG: thioredoxin [Marinilabiliales bacterium]|nr:MAG: thioredoxin [Marinilabiliales bacterium]
MKNFRDLKNSNTPLLVDFWADWCQPCKMMQPILKEVKHHFGDKVNIIKVNVDKNQVAAGRYMIQNIPTIMIFKNGNTVFKQAGVMQSASLINELNKHIL